MADEGHNPAFLPAPYDAFRELAQRLIQVPKEEADAKEEEYQREREGKPKPGPKSSEKH